MSAVKFALGQAMKVQKEVEVELYSFFNLGANHARLLYPGAKDPVPILYEAELNPHSFSQRSGEFRPKRDSIPEPFSL